MPRPTSLTGWWYQLLVKRANGNVALLASMLETTSKTLGRWASGEIKLPGLEHRRNLRKIAGDKLLNRDDCPKYLRLVKKQRVADE